MPTIQEVRQKFPQYSDMSDTELADALHRKFYADLPRDDFDKRIGLAEAPKQDPAGVRDAPNPDRPTALAASNQGIVQGMTLGFGDELMAGLMTPIEMGVRAYKGEDWSPGASYDAALERERRGLNAAQEAHPIATGVGQLAGGAVTGGGLANAGLSAAARAASAGQGLGKVALGSAVDGAVLGAASGFGGGEGFGNRLADAASGGAIGFGVGAIVPGAVAAVPAVAKSIASPILARIQPGKYADDALATYLRRAGMSADDVVNELRAAAADQQGVYSVADALGHTGQRAMSTVARNPHDARQELIDFLNNRQAGQGRRVSGALADAFEAPDTAAQRAASLTAARDNAADVSYAAVRQGAGPVDVSPAVAKIDEVLQPGISRLASPQTNIADDTVEGALRRARGLLTDDRSNLSDFSAILRAKQEIDDMIGRATRSGAGNQARLLIGVKSELDNALSGASPGYAAARDAFRQGSREIDAVDAGRSAAMRGRSEDTTAAFANMTPGEQAAFRAGYVDPYIAQTQGGAIGVNKVRPLMNDATSVEFPAFAAPGRADSLARQLQREHQMFETRNAATGGSKTADNLADAADMAQFDPSILSTLARGGWKDAAVQAGIRALSNMKGQPAPVRELLARILMETGPDQAASVLLRAQAGRQSSDRAKELVRALLTASGSTEAGLAF